MRQLPVDWRKLEENLPDMWHTWDRDGDGTLGFDELMHPVNGLLAFVRSAFGKGGGGGGGAGGGDAAAPDLRTQALAWFDYFDEDHGGTLDKDEVVRAIIKVGQSPLSSVRAIIKVRCGAMRCSVVRRGAVRCGERR